MTHNSSDESELDYQDDDTVVELGMPDRTASEYDRLDPFVSRLGGQPTWLTTPVPDSNLLCPVCAVKMFLLVQFECPVEGGSLDRVLYLFACNTKKCANTAPNQAFKAILQARPVQVEKEPASKPSATNFWEPAVLDTATEKEEQVPTEYVSCSFKTKNALPVTVLKIVEELIRPQKEPKTGQVSTQMGDQQDDSSEEETAKEDEVMEAFLNRIAHYPRQCLRYSPHGRPLHFSQRHADMFSSSFKCDHCQQQNPVHFLAQLMPAFLSIVPVDEHVEHIPVAERGKFGVFGDGLEFATVLVLQCGGCGAVGVSVELEEYHL